MAISVTTAHDGDAGELAAVAAATFPLACPDGVPAEDIAAFITAHLSEERFREYIAAADRAVLTAAAEGRIVGYAMLVRGSDGVELSTMDGVELSKMYVLPGHHGTGAATVLMRSAIDWAAGRGAESVWLGVNRKNDRAQRFYRKHGFEITGTRTFQLGDRAEHDYLMARRL
jgi:GNAT superfamily N-acetyltransferase